MPMLDVSVSVYSYSLCSVDLVSPVLLVSSSPWLLLSFSTPLLQNSLSSERRDLMEVPHLGVSVPKSLTLGIMSVLSFVFPSAAGGIVSDND